MQTLFATEEKRAGLSILPRDYQDESVGSSIRLWNSGVLGALVRAFTGAGKTIIACMLIDWWLKRGEDYRAMVLSYEIQLCDQFSQEIEDVLGMRPGIERDKQQWEGQPICVASRQTLLPKKLADADQKAWFAQRGIDDVGLLTASLAKTLIRQLSKNEIDTGDVRAMIGEHNCHWMTNDRGIVSRVHRFDPSLNWLIIADEAHKFTYGHKGIGHVYDWFGQNQNTRWLGITATPKRADGVSIGHKLFPGIALDLPLYSPRGRCAVKEGYAVPYSQKYICVEGLDFKSITKVAGDFSEEELGRVLGNEEQLAKLCEPMLDMCGDRRTLIFSPTVQMAKDCASYINARARCRCDCGKVKWYPSLLIGDGAQCPQCNALMEVRHIVLSGEQCHAVYGDIPAAQRKPVYERHQAGKFQFLSVCGLCKEGYNDPDIACVSVFRPVSKAAASLAEQMKGRACRPLRGLIEGMSSAQERLDAIANSRKPDALIIDLVGITGLDDCASTVLIYSEGLPDEVQELANDLLIEGKAENVMLAIEQAQQKIEADKEQIRQQRLAQDRREKEEAERRAKAGAEVSYSSHEVGSGTNVDPSRVTDKQLKGIAWRGMSFNGWEPSKKQASRMIGQLESGILPDRVAYQNGVPEGCWSEVTCYGWQIKKLRRVGYRGPISELTPKQAHAELRRLETPGSYYLDAVLSASSDDLDLMGPEIARLRKERRITEDEYQTLKNRGLSRRQQLESNTEPPQEF